MVCPGDYVFVDRMVATKTSWTSMISLQPVVIQRLVEFRRRRNLLLTVKGVAAAMALALLVGLLCALIDTQWSLSDAARWMIALAIYTSVAGIIALGVIRPRWRGDSLVWLAGLFEQLEPSLRDRLLPAVELANDLPASFRSNSRALSGSRSPAELDSPAFRLAVQQGVAEKIQPIEIAKILPWQLVRPWMMVAAVTAVVVAILSFVPELYLANRLGRILFLWPIWGVSPAWRSRLSSPHRPTCWSPTRNR